MRLTRRAALGIAVACGVGAALLLLVFLKAQQRAGPIAPPKVLVNLVVAAQDIPQHTLITSAMVKTIQVEEGAKPPGSASAVAEVVSRMTNQPIAAEEPILMRLLAERNGAGLAYTVPPGMRAITLAIDPVSGVADFLKPGDRVDVLASFDYDGGAVAKTVLQDVQLLAIGERTALDQAAAPPADAKDAAAERPKPQPSTTATLAVAPSQAPRLLLAAEKGTLRLALRAPGDHALQPVIAADTLTLIGAPMTAAAAQSTEPAPAKQAPPAAPALAPPPSLQAPSAPPRPSVEVIRGDKRETVTP